MNEDLKHRLGGLLLLAMGVGAGWYFLLEPLEAAKAGAAEVRYSLKAFLMVPFCVLLGVAFLVAGRRLDYRDVERGTLKPTGWGLFALIVVLTAAGFWWFRAQFLALGYS